MIKMHCDKCGKEIEGPTYYTISFHAHDINPVNKYANSFITYSYNLTANMAAALNAEKHFCRKCIEKIESFINNKV